MYPTQRIAAVIIVAATLASTAWAVDGRLDLGLQSKFVWRGIVLNSEPAFQPAVTVSAHGLTVTVWGNADLKDNHGQRNEFNEVDYIATYTIPTAAVDVSATWYVYAFPNTSAPSTTEVWLAAAFKELPATPTVTLVRDIDVVDGWYAFVTASQPLGVLRSTVSDGLVLTFNAGRGDRSYTRAYFPGVERSNATDYGLRLDWPLRLGPGTLTVNAQFADLANAQLRRVAANGHESLWAGMTYAIQF